MGTVIVHVLLLLIDGADRAQTFRLARGQIFSEGQFAIDGIQVAPEVSQLLPNGFAGHFRGVFTASCVFQVIFPGAFTVPKCSALRAWQVFCGTSPMCWPS